MFKRVSKFNLAVALAPVSLSVGLVLGSASVAQAGYLTDSRGAVSTNSYGECWTATGGMDAKVEACGDAMPKEPMAMPMDSDGDGVPDDRDQCPGTPRGVKVDSVGCPIDSDGDGVPDYRDKCPGTPRGARVNDDGCEIVADVTINTTTDHFDFDSAKLKPAMKEALYNIATKIRSSKGDEYLEVIGHTDATGPEAYNQQLSERRAQSAAKYLSEQGIASDHISVSGRGESEPVASNADRAGRAQNRRVEIRSR